MPVPSVGVSKTEKATDKRPVLHALQAIAVGWVLPEIRVFVWWSTGAARSLCFKLKKAAHSLHEHCC